ncbi:iron ABC transporter permease [Vibrio cincinnatiensis]|uniref:ABC transporter permease n=1 Tax=Vibrio cincinnatiensis TaxID=675 RepID=UPI001EDD9669|nr:iron ABC transporter permease [Vibrio cincinnatiensis]MCG3758150.1 iron ABC transporter permease [Vibrio cincinnatiensis]MCG3761446.1 iron ABC transporter permease [Vibrio cincinnatiensis]
MSVISNPYDSIRQKRQRAPFYLLLSAGFISLLMLIPLCYLVLRASQAEYNQLIELVFRARNWQLLLNTLSLTGGVLLIGTLLALPLAWLVTRSNIAAKRGLTVLAIVPLAIPGYVMAYALLGIGGNMGALAHLFGLRISNISGYWGAVWALALYTYPYIFLNLRAALQGLDSSLEESAHSLGYSRFATFRFIMLPHLLPALLAGYIVVALYVLGDFGAVALMRYEAFSFAIFNQYSGAFDRIYAAWLSIMLLALAGSFLLVEYYLLKRKRLASVGSGIARQAKPFILGHWALPAWLYIGTVFLLSIGLPLAMLSYWMIVIPPDYSLLMQVPFTFARSALAAAPAALLAAIMAIPLCYLATRYPSPLTRTMERSAYIGYALPPLTLALAMVFFALHSAFFLYQTLTLLIFTWSLATLALAMGPIRSALIQTRKNTEEAAQSLGYSSVACFFYVVLPRLRRGILASLALVFLFCMKELPITFLLAPTGYHTLAVTVFSRTSEGMMAEAAPFATAIVLFSSLSIGLILNREKIKGIE